MFELNEEEMTHSSEKQIYYIKNIASAIINTNDLDLDQQTAKTIEIITKIKEGSNA